MKKILIAIDYNPCAQKIAETGFAIATAMQAKICIVHAIADVAHYSMEYNPIMGFAGFSPDCAFKKMEDQEKEAKGFLAAVKIHLGDANIETKVVDGITSAAILNFCKEWGADLVVMGALSHKRIGKSILGDVSSVVLRNSEVPVLIVPTDKKDLITTFQSNAIHQYI